MNSFTIRLVTDGNDPAIMRFAELQDAVYPDPEMLIPGSFLGQLIEMSNDVRQNMLLVAEDVDSRVVGGCVFHYLAATNTGFSSFLGVALDHRQMGVARALHEARFAALDAAARAQEHTEVVGLFIDVVAPERLSPEALEQERLTGTAPQERREVFKRLGFRVLNIPYEQPVGRSGPVTELDLLFCPRHPLPDELASVVPTSLVLETLTAYWLPWLGRERTAAAIKRLADYINGSLIALSDPSRPRTL